MVSCLQVCSLQTLRVFSFVPCVLYIGPDEHVAAIGSQDGRQPGTALREGRTNFDAFASLDWCSEPIPNKCKAVASNNSRGRDASRPLEAMAKSA